MVLVVLLLAVLCIDLLLLLQNFGLFQKVHCMFQLRRRQCGRWKWRTHPARRVPRARFAELGVSHAARVLPVPVGLGLRGQQSEVDVTSLIGSQRSGAWRGSNRYSFCTNFGQPPHRPVQLHSSDQRSCQVNNIFVLGQDANRHQHVHEHKMHHPILPQVAFIVDNNTTVGLFQAG